MLHSVSALLQLDASSASTCCPVAAACAAPRFLVSHRQAVAPSPLFTSIIGDFTEATIRQQLMDACGGNCDVVLCDAAPNSSGQQWCVVTACASAVTPQLAVTSCRADHLRSVELCSAALQVACSLLSSSSSRASTTGGAGAGAAEGSFVTKLWAGGEQQQLLSDMRSRYRLSFPPPHFSFPYVPAVHSQSVSAASPL